MPSSPTCEAFVAGVSPMVQASTPDMSDEDLLSATQELEQKVISGKYAALPSIIKLGDKSQVKRNASNWP